MFVPPPPGGPQLDYEVGKAIQQDVEAQIELRHELAEARSEQPQGTGGLWAWLRARLGRR